MSKTKKVVAFVAILLSWPMTWACSAAQLRADEAKAVACVEREDVKQCQGDALAACFIAESKCDERATVIAMAHCLKLCESPAGDAGAPGQDGG